MQLLDLPAQGVPAVVRALHGDEAAPPEDAASVYEFNHHRIHHRFCPTCGIHPYADAVDPKGNAMRAINIRCLEDIDLASIPVTHFDGRSKP